MKWPHTSLKSVAKLIQYGYTASASDEAIGPKFLRITDIVPAQIDWASVPHCAIDDADHAKYKIDLGDIVIARTGNTTGYAKLIREDVDAVFASYLIRVKVKESIASAAFVGQLVESNLYKRFVDAHKGGAAQGNANAQTLTMFEFPLPPIDVQQRIAERITAYDDLIENNTRRMALLERAARLLYEEWFVRLRFPGHEHTPTIDGLPKGWRRYAISELSDIRRGASPRPIAAFMGGTVPWFKIGDATASEAMFVFETAERVTEDGAKKSVRLPPGELILSNSATCGLPYFTATEGCIHDGWLHLAPNGQVSREVLYCIMCAKKDELVGSVSDGSTQKNLNIEAAQRVSVALPITGDLIGEFDEAARSMFQMIRTLAHYNRRLRQARDLLLPRLISGELAV